MCSHSKSTASPLFVQRQTPKQLYTQEYKWLQFSFGQDNVICAHRPQVTQVSFYSILDPFIYFISIPLRRAPPLFISRCCAGLGELFILGHISVALVAKGDRSLRLNQDPALTNHRPVAAGEESGPALASRRGACTNSIIFLDIFLALSEPHTSSVFEKILTRIALQYWSSGNMPRADYQQICLGCYPVLQALECLVRQAQKRHTRET